LLLAPRVADRFRAIRVVGRLLVASALLKLLAASALPNPQVLLYLSELLVDAVIARTQVASLLLAWLLFVTAKILLLLCHTHHCGAGWPLW
jgi:hypothetical protein